MEPHIAACNAIFDPNTSLTRQDFGRHVNAIAKAAVSGGLCVAKTLEKQQKLETKIDEVWNLRTEGNFIGILNHDLFSSKLIKRGNGNAKGYTLLPFDSELINKMTKHLIIPSLQRQNLTTILESNHLDPLATWRAKFALMTTPEVHILEYIIGLENLGPIYDGYYADALERAFSRSVDWVKGRKRNEGEEGVARLYKKVIDLLETYPNINMADCLPGEKAIINNYKKVLDELPSACNRLNGSTEEINKYLEQNNVEAIQSRAKALILARLKARPS